jgi:hypothetical protein
MAGKRMVELGQKISAHLAKTRQGSLIRRAMNQAARELVLAEASDWPFIMKTGTMVPYANKRVMAHISRFTRLYEDLMKNSIDEKWLAEVEYRDNIFHDLDCAAYYAPLKSQEVSHLAGQPETVIKPIVRHSKKVKPTRSARRPTTPKTRQTRKKTAAPKKWFKKVKNKAGLSRLDEMQGAAEE